MQSETFGGEAVVWRAGTLLGLVLSLWLVLPAQQSHWNNLQRKYSASIVVLASSENLDRGLSCGFFISNKGQLAAVIPEPARQQVLLARRADGSFIKTRVLKSNPQLRLAILQASISASQPFRLGDSSKVKVGDAAGAFGYTTAGRLVIQPVTIAKIQRTPDGVKVLHLMPPPESFLSGAPVVNRRGEVIGIVTRVADKPPACALPVGYLKNFPVPRPSANASASLSSTAQESPLWQKFQPVVQAARQIADLGARTEALATLARITMQSGFSDKAQILLQEAIDTANKLQDVEERSFALKRVALQLGQQNRWQEAVQLAAQIPDWLQKATVLRELSQQAARAGQLEQALTIARQIEDPHHRCAALVTA
ncbi:MAG: serine protease, partial [Fimbriimonadales bacterium]|nr:serine protease [Fimbriimonadales bacterium]